METLRTSTLAHIALLMLLVLLSYGNTLSGSFHLDDYMYIVENPLVTDQDAIFSPDSLLEYPSLPEPLIRTRFSRWLGYLSFNLNHRLKGLDVRGYHAVNILIHMINGLLLYALLRLSFAALRRNADTTALISLLGAALFVAHPIQTQAVTYISQRFTLMATMFSLAAIIAYIKWRSRPKSPYFALAVLMSTAAMFSKENSFVLPVAVVIYEFCFFRDDKRSTRQRLAALAPLLATMLIVPVTIIGSSPIEGSSGIADSTVLDSDIPRSTYLITQSRVIMTYMRLLVLPVSQNLDYDYPLFASPTEPMTLLSIITICSALLGALWGCWRLMRSGTTDRQAAWVPVAVGTLWVFVFLSVESSVIVLVNVIFEHRMYLPMIGVSMIAAGSASALADRHGQIAKPMALACAAIVLALTITSYNRNMVWSNEITLWSDVVAKSPMKPGGHNELGLALMAEGRNKEAITELEIAVKMKPDYAKSHLNLALLYVIESDFENVAKHCAEAVLHHTGNYPTCLKLGDLLAANGRPEGALLVYEGLVRFAPTDPALSKRLKSVQTAP